jgi:hypothetical protein
MDSKEEIPFGWKRQNGVFIKNDLEQWIIKRIQDETYSGKSLDEITLDLTRVGVKPRNGGLWFPRRIKKVLAENEKMRGSLISESKPAEEENPPAQATEPAHADPLPQAAPILTSSIRPGAIDYRIRECCQTIEKCKHEASQRSLEIGKIITRALILAIPGKRRKQEFMEEGENELQNRELREGQH